ncbi:transcription initiation factor TFIID subunit 7-like [Diabrotica undecimpunctata]|uniref:transcription initiation factor TFIID subunit 7-like n=1 Tax=Diabrotica undecimpunctata TaxID=50387 RepID=UPI003B63CA52
MNQNSVNKNKTHCKNNEIYLEEQFILRLPVEEARQVRTMLHFKPEKIKKCMKISVDPVDNKVAVDLNHKRLFGNLQKLPTIIESQKTNIDNNKSLLYKSADICYLADCSCEESSKKKAETPHGICPPLKNVKTKRFRKTLSNKESAFETESISKELYHLLRADLEACFTRFEIIYTDDISKDICKKG